jgi:hypothetical protein
MGELGYGLRCREVKSGFCQKDINANRFFSATLIDLKSGKPLLSLYGTEWRERVKNLKCREVTTGFCQKR